jgi:uncharacterized protein
VGCGAEGENNGAILFIFTEAKKMRVEVGYGLESTLTDAKSKRITSTVIKPLIVRGDVPGAVEAGADAMLAVVAARTSKAPARPKRRARPFTTSRAPCR